MNYDLWYEFVWIWFLQPEPRNYTHPVGGFSASWIFCHDRSIICAGFRKIKPTPHFELLNAECWMIEPRAQLLFHKESKRMCLGKDEHNGNPSKTYPKFVVIMVFVSFFFFSSLSLSFFSCAFFLASFLVWLWYISLAYNYIPRFNNCCSGSGYGSSTGSTTLPPTPPPPFCMPLIWG